MRLKLLLLFFAVQSVCICATVSAQTAAPHFNHISVDKGLSQSTVYCVIQDTLGFIWMGTQDGLNRYDGNRFKVYRPAKANPTAISSFYIRYLFKDSRGRLWVGGNGGISVYNMDKDNFTNFNIMPQPGDWYVSCIAQDAKGTIWAATSSGELFNLNPATNKFQPVKVSPPGNNNPIYYFTFWGNKLLLGTENGLSIYDPATLKNQSFSAGVGNIRINVIYADNQNFWVGTEGKGMVRINKETGKSTNYTQKSTKLADDYVRAIEKDGSGNLWIGTFRGLSLMTAKGTIQNYYHAPDAPQTLSQNSVRCVFRDRQDGMWLGTFYGGINYYNNQLSSFNYLNQGSGTLSLNDNVVNVIKEDSKGGIWIGTEGGGLDYWHQGNNTIQYFTNGTNGASLSSNNIKSIAFGADGTVYLGTHNAGLNILNPATGHVEKFMHNPLKSSSISGDMVYGLLKDYKNSIWVGTRTGLDIFDVHNKTFTSFVKDKNGRSLSSNEVTYLMQDSQHRIWIGTTNGVNIYDVNQNSLLQVSNLSLSNDVINFITQDQKQRIWIGTRDGINLFDEKKLSFINYDQRKDFLKGNINSILADSLGNLWIALNKSIVKYNPDKHTSISYVGNAGMDNIQFNVYAGCQSSAGKLFFGGVNGIIYFRPAVQSVSAQKINIVFTGLEVLNRPVVSGDETSIIKDHINNVDHLKFNHEQKQFTILFNTFNFISPNLTKYLFRLDNYDKQWQQTEDIPKATYTNLPAGHYTFHVKAIGPQGELSPERSITIIIMPVWYKSTWFYCLMFLIIAIGSVFLYRILTQRMRAMHQLKLERLQREKLRYINQVKMDFFTNISHEIRTPLTLIMAPLEEILQLPDSDKKRRKLHLVMMKNARRLYNIVNQLFEFKKAEMGTRRLCVGKYDLIAFLNEVFTSFVPLAEKNKINYTFEASVNNLYLLFDKGAVENILFNLLSNAFKYTQAGDTILVKMSSFQNEIGITVKDTGKGIAKEQIDRVFERFYQVAGQQTNLGSGVGLAFTKKLAELHHGRMELQSTLGAGSAFTFYLPVSEDLYQEDAHVEDAKIDNSLTDESGILSSENIIINSGMEISREDSSTDTILLVDDNPDIIDYMKSFFDIDYKVLTASDGKMALKILSDQQIDIIISDVMMPEMDGLHFCKKVKHNIQTSHIPLVLLTAKSEISQQVKGIDLGADDYITKPFSIALLDAKVKGILRMRKKLREFYATEKGIEPEKLTFNDIDEDFLKKAIAIVETNMDQYNFSVETFSRDLGMSRSNLYLKLKAITGESVTAFIKRIRLNKAAKLIEERKYALSEIAYMCGYSTPSYFSTSFKQFYGCMPTEYLTMKNKI